MVNNQENNNINKINEKVEKGNWNREDEYDGGKW